MEDATMDNQQQHDDEDSLRDQLCRRLQPYSDEYDPMPPRLLEQTNPIAFVVLLRPSFPANPMPLLRIAPLDKAGIRQQLLLDAAYVLSGNKPGRLLDKDELGPGWSLVPPPNEKLYLEPGAYRYACDSSEGPATTSDWSEIPNFSKWKFPHREFSDTLGGFLSHWRLPPNLYQNVSRTQQPSQSDLSIAIKARDKGRCILSAWMNALGLQCCHLIPKSEAVKEWFIAQDMAQYDVYRASPPTMDQRNLITLRSDLHGSLFDFQWVPYPVKDLGVFIAHYLDIPGDNDRREMGQANWYHGVPLRLDSLVAVTSLFARFAYNIFELAGLDLPQKRKSHGSAGASQSGSASTSEFPAPGSRNSGSLADKTSGSRGSRHRKDKEDEVGASASASKRGRQELSAARQNMAILKWAEAVEPTGDIDASFAMHPDLEAVDMHLFSSF